MRETISENCSKTNKVEGRKEGYGKLLSTCQLSRLRDNGKIPLPPS